MTIPHLDPVRPRPVQGPQPGDDELMAAALAEAEAALAHGDVPVGAVVVAGGEIVARRHNERQLQQDPTAHAEMLALRDAARSASSWRLTEATLVVTLEPCVMCAGALVAARLDRVVFGAADPKGGACGSLFNVLSDPRLNHEVAVVGGVRAEEAGEMLARFFAERRG
jgi:tRNA(adenine34) deaminase